MQTQTMPTFGVGEPTKAQVAPQEVLPVGTATLNGTVSYYCTSKDIFVQRFCDLSCTYIE